VRGRLAPRTARAGDAGAVGRTLTQVPSFSIMVLRSSANCRHSENLRERRHGGSVPLQRPHPPPRSKRHRRPRRVQHTWRAETHCALRNYIAKSAQIELLFFFSTLVADTSMALFFKVCGSDTDPLNAASSTCQYERWKPLGWRSAWAQGARTRLSGKTIVHV